MKANLRFINMLLGIVCVFFEAGAQNINVDNATTPCGVNDPGDCGVNGNQVSLSITSPNPDPMLDPLYVPRFKAFWVMGDGNFIETLGDDVASDASSLNVSQYNYIARAGDQMTTTAYLTGKYTNTTPPPEYERIINIGGTVTNTPPAFHARVNAAETMDIHSNQELRKDNLTTFVISYPNGKTGRVLYFFNGQKDLSTGAISNSTRPILQYETSNIPKYFKDNGMNSVDQGEVGALPSPFGGIFLNNGFINQISRKYRNVLAYPAETVASSSMPATFTEKRQFPVLRANPTIHLSKSDSIQSFLALLLSDKPLNPDVDLFAYQQVSQMLGSVGLDLSPQSVIATDNNDAQWYIVGAQDLTLAYRAGFDPNQLVVENIEPENGFYRVTFNLSICNAGAGDVLNEKIGIHYPKGAFWDFQYPMTQGINSNGYNYSLVSQNDEEWNFNIQMFLHGVPQPLPGQGHQEVCQSITFTALTDCNGVRSLWSENGGQAVEACVVFMESFGQEETCTYNFPVNSDQFKDVDGNCICCKKSDNTSCPPCDVCDWRYCILVLIALLLLLLVMLKKKFIPWLTTWLS